MTRRNALKRIVMLASAILSARFGRAQSPADDPAFTDTRYRVPFATPCPARDGYAPVGRYVAMQPQGNPLGICGVTVDGVDYTNAANAGDDSAGWIVCREWYGYPTPPTKEARRVMRSGARSEPTGRVAPAYTAPDGTVYPAGEMYRSVGVPYVIIRGDVRYQFDPKRRKTPSDVAALMRAYGVCSDRAELAAACAAADAGSSGRVRTLDGVTEFGIDPNLRVWSCGSVNDSKVSA